MRTKRNDFLCGSGLVSRLVYVYYFIVTYLGYSTSLGNVGVRDLARTLELYPFMVRRGCSATSGRRYQGHFIRFSQ